MTITDGVHKVCVHVGSELIEKMLLNISPDWLSRVVGKVSTRCPGAAAGETIHFRGVHSILEQKEHYAVN